MNATALPEATERLSHTYPCGCVEVWFVLQVPPEEEPRDVIVPEPCHRRWCTDVEAHKGRCRSTLE